MPWNWPWRRPAPEVTVEEPVLAEALPTAPVPALVVGPTRISAYAPNAGRVMITDGGPHPASAWAQISAEHIAPLAPDLAGDRRREAVQLQLNIAAALEHDHRTAQDSERTKLAADSAHLLTEIDVVEHVESAMTVLPSIFAEAGWGAHFLGDGVAETIQRELAVHMGTVKHIERSWHVDRLLAKDKNHPHALAWRAKHHPGVK